MAKIVNGQIEWEKDDFGGITLFGIDIKAPYQGFFKYCYLQHDSEYQAWKVGGNSNTRKIIDREFLKNMIKTCKMKGKYLRIPVAISLYGFVRVFGWIVWNNKENSLWKK